MTSLFRRAGSKIAKFLHSTSDPAAVASQVQVFTRTVDGVEQLYARTSAGTIYPITPPPSTIILPSGALMSTAPTPYAGWWFHDDFTNVLVSTLANGGGGTGTINCPSVGEPGGVLQTVTAVSDSNRIQVGLTGVTWMCFGGGIAYFRTSGLMSAVPNAVDDIRLRIGFLDPGNGTADATDGVYLELDRVANGSTNWFLCAANNTAKTPVDTGIPATNTRQILEIEVNAAGTSAICRINGVAGAAPVANNIPITTARATQIMIQTSKETGAGAVTYNPIYYSAGITFTTAR